VSPSTPAIRSFWRVTRFELPRRCSARALVWAKARSSITPAATNLTTIASIACFTLSMIGASAISALRTRRLRTRRRPSAVLG
jgi:hypothetical protein